jgi:hypothetical protein
VRAVKWGNWGDSEVLPTLFWGKVKNCNPFAIFTDRTGMNATVKVII